MLLEHAVALGHQLLEARELAGWIAAVAEERQLEPALVLEVDRLEELLRFGRVDEHRDAQAAGRGPDRVELRIVDGEAGPVGLAEAQAEALRDFADADGAGLDVRLELRDRLRAPAGADVAEIDVGELHHAVLEPARLEGGDRPRQPIALRPAGVDQQPQVDGVHPLDHPRELLVGDRRRLVTVDVDDREPGLRHRMLRGLERRARLVLRIVGSGNSGVRPSPGRRMTPPDVRVRALARPPPRPGRRRPSWVPRRRPRVSAAARADASAMIRVRMIDGASPVNERKAPQCACKPNSVRLRRRALRPAGSGETTIPLGPPSLTGSSDLPGSFGRAVLEARFPIWSCSVRGFACHVCYQPRGALLPHLFTLTRLRPQPCGHELRQGGIFSVPLSFGLPRPGVTRRTALRSSDFPPPPHARLQRLRPRGDVGRWRSSGSLRRDSDSAPHPSVSCEMLVLLELLVEVAARRVDRPRPSSRCSSRSRAASSTRTRAPTLSLNSRSVRRAHPVGPSAAGRPRDCRLHARRLATGAGRPTSMASRVAS